MLRHIYKNDRVVRFDDRVYEDLGLLASVSGRTRGELIHTAITNLLQENSVYFSEYIFVDYLEQFLNGNVEKESCDIAGIKVDLGYDDDDNYIVHFVISDTDGKTLEDEICVYDDIDELDNFLRQLSYKIDHNHDDVKNYLRHRVDYR